MEITVGHVMQNKYGFFVMFLNMECRCVFHHLSHVSEHVHCLAFKRRLITIEHYKSYNLKTTKKNFLIQAEEMALVCCMNVNFITDVKLDFDFEK